MSDDKKNQFLIFLKNTVNILDSELLTVQKQIEIANHQIDLIQEKLKSTTQAIVLIETRRKELESLSGQLRATREKEQTNIEHLKYEMEEIKCNAERIMATIRAKRAAIDAMGIFSFLAKALMELIDELTGDYRNAMNRIRELEERFNELERIGGQSAERLERAVRDLGQIDVEKKNLDMVQNDCDTRIKQLGRDKTSTEDFKLELAIFKNRCQLFIDQLKLNIEFPDDMLNTQKELEENLKQLYSKYNRGLPQGILPFMSRL